MPLSDIIFDLDNTLYPASAGLLPVIGARIVSFVQQRLGLDEAAARALSDDYYHSHGLTVCGLRAEHGVDAEEYFRFIHDLDYAAFLAPAPELDTRLAALPQRKSIFTNAPAFHAAAVLARLGIAHHFDRIFDVAWTDFQPKPHPASYGRVLAELGCPPECAVLIEDTARNLPPARALGMRTVWVGEGPAPAGADAAAATVVEALSLIAEWG